MASHAVDVQSLVVEYSGTRVLDGVTCSIDAQNVTCIVGTSGCGKTTLLKTILQLVPAASGSIELLGEDVIEREPEERAELLLQVGVLFQNGALLNSLTVAENIALPLRLHTDLPDEVIARVVREKLEIVNLPGAQNLLPPELSGGMKKRAALARAIVLDPRVVFFDEPSAGLDPVSSARLDMLMLSLKKHLRMTLVVVTHKLSSIFTVADKIVFLDEGHVVFDGTLKAARASDIEVVAHFFDPFEERATEFS